MKLTPERLDALTELINIGVGQAAGTLSQMLEFTIKLKVPLVKILSPQLLQQELRGRLGQQYLSSVKLEFSGSFSGNAQLVFPTESAATLVSLLTGEESETNDLDALRIGTLTEVGNIVINGVMGSISNILTQPINYNLPNYIEQDIEHLLLSSISEQNYKEVLLAQSQFDIEELEVKGDIILFFNVGSLDSFLEAIDELCDRY